MTRYFQSLIPTGRPLTVGDRTFSFEPVEPMGGSWLGALAVDDDAAASYLAGNGVDEITVERFEGLKKKRQAQTTQGSAPSPAPRLPPVRLEASAARAERPTDRTVGNNEASGAAQGTNLSGNLVSVELRTTTKEPPHEALLDQPRSTRRKAA